MSLNIRRLSKFDKNFKKYVTQKKDRVAFSKALDYLLYAKKLPKDYDDHQLDHQEKGVRDFHLENDLVIIYYLKIGDSINFIDVGPHKKVFNHKKKILNSSIKRSLDL